MTKSRICYFSEQFDDLDMIYLSYKNKVISVISKRAHYQHLKDTHICYPDRRHLQLIVLQEHRN